jgi:hypothetical protein
MMTTVSSGLPTHPEGGYDEVRYLGKGHAEYRLRGELHRENGPALITKEGDEHWFEHGRRHRIGGPAVVTRNGAEQWWLHGIRAEDV